jgi:PAS domain S-box-containing protein
LHPSSAIRGRPLSIRARLLLLVLAVLVPAASFAAVLLVRYAAAERVDQQEDARVLANRASAAIDRELVGLMAALEALATSPALQEGGDLAAFDAQARALLRTRGTFVAMRDRTGRQIVNTALPFGSPLPTSTDPVLLATDRAVFETGRTSVSDIYSGAATKRLLVLVAAPVRRAGEVAYSLNIALEPVRLAEVLAAVAPPDWTVAIVDRNDRVVARSRGHERLVGSEATADLRERTRESGGTWIGTTLEGTPVLGAYARSPVSGWRVAVGVPMQVIEAPLRRLTWVLAGATTLVLALSSALAAWFARGIATPVGTLAGAAQRLGRGERIAPIRTGLREANAVGQALAEASTALREREAERDRAEARHRELAALVANSADLVAVLDADASIATLNEAGARLLGLAGIEAARGRPFLDFVHPDDRARFEAEALPAVARTGSWSGEIALRHDPSGRAFPAIQDLFRIEGEGMEGRPRLGTVVRDVTERKAAEEALRQSEVKFQTIADSIDQMIWSTRPDGFHDYYNARWYDYTGVPAGSTDGESWNGMFHPDDQDRAWAIWRRCLETGEPYHIEYRLRHRSGQYRWVIGRAQCVRDASGAIARWYGTCTDVHDLKVAQNALRDINATLADRVAAAVAERDRIWRLSTDLMLVARFDAQIVAVNPAWGVTLGWTDEEIVGARFIDLVHPDDVAGTLAEAGRLAEGLTTLRFENRYRRRDGTYRWLSWTAVPEAGFIHAIARDITAEREAAEQLLRTEEQLRQSQKMEVVGQLTGGVAHDFNNLLTVVTGHLDMARRRLHGGDPRLLRNIENALEGAQRAATLTHRLLAFSRQSPLQPQPLDLGRVVGGMSDLIRRTLGETIAIETVTAAGLWRTEADLNGVENAILNLCVNARDAMPDGGKLTIETANTRLDEGYPAVARGDVKAGQYVMVAVCDTGAGMPSEIRDRVFEPFFTTKPVGKGTGLGLSQVYGFLRQSGGHAAIYSEVGEGTTVKLYFPRLRAGAAEEAPEEPAFAPAVAEGLGETILVVEDEVMVRDFTVAALEEAGYRVLAAGDGPSGLRLLDAHPDVSLLFTDVVLAGPMNGRKVADEALRRRPDLKVLFTTGYTRNAIVHHGRLDEDVELITKPFTAAGLAEKVARMLERAG